MWFKWNCFRDFIVGYLTNVLLVAVGLFGAITGLAYLVITYAYGDYLPSVQWVHMSVAILVPSVLLAQGIAYFRIARRLIPGERIEECLAGIAKLREEGVNELYNYNINISTEKDFEEFKKKFLEWHKRLIPEIEKLSPSQASIFQVLGTVTYQVRQDASGLEAKVAHMKGIIKEYNDRLKVMVDKFSLENLSNRVKT